MLPNCKKSCNQCNPTPPVPTCYDLQSSCGSWKNDGWCTRDTTYMGANCKKTCGNCDSPGPTPGPTGDKVKVSLYYES